MKLISLITRYYTCFFMLIFMMSCVVQKEIVINSKEKLNVYKNEKFIDRFVYSEQYTVELDHMDLFENIFASLPDSVVVYPSENYYYFEFVYNNIQFQGNIGLFKDLVSKGQINFGFYRKPGLIMFDQEEIINNYFTLGLRDSLGVQKLNEFSTKLEFKNKVVIFNAYQFNESSFANSPNESINFIAPTLDESGTYFKLCFNNDYNHFLWILDYNNLTDNLIKLNDRFYFGQRTDFVFYKSSFDEYILIGVHLINSYNNNWHDGPFDQLPDNYIADGTIDLKPYLCKAYPEECSSINKFGSYKDEDDVRLALVNYSLYNNINLFIENTTKLLNDSNSETEFLSKICKK